MYEYSYVIADGIFFKRLEWGSADERITADDCYGEIL